MQRSQERKNRKHRATLASKREAKATAEAGKQKAETRKLEEEAQAHLDNTPHSTSSKKSSVPSPSRDRRGRLRRGHAFLPNAATQASRVAALRKAMLGAVTDKDIICIIRKLVALAKVGDMSAVHELLNRLLGKPLEADILERLEALEAGAKPEG